MHHAAYFLLDLNIELSAYLTVSLDIVQMSACRLGNLPYSKYAYPTLTSHPSRGLYAMSGNLRRVSVRSNLLRLITSAISLQSSNGLVWSNKYGGSKDQALNAY